MHLNLNIVKSLQILFFFCFVILGSTLLSAQTTTADSLAKAQKHHDELMAIIMTQPKVPIKTIGIYVYDGYNTLDAIGPYQVLSELMSVDIFFVAKEKGMVKNQRGLKVQVDKSISDVKQLDILVIPGGAIETFMQTQDTAVLNWIRRIDKTSKYTTSVCTGGWILGAAGLLKGKNATTNWYPRRGIHATVWCQFQAGTLCARRQILDLRRRYRRHGHGPRHHGRPDGKKIHSRRNAGFGIRPQATLQCRLGQKDRTDCSGYDAANVRHGTTALAGKGETEKGGPKQKQNWKPLMTMGLSSL